MGTADVTLYAIWTANTYTVTFDEQEGMPTGQTKTVTYDGTYGTLATVTYAGHTFEGWRTAPHGPGTEVTAATTVTATSDHTLYTSWDYNGWMRLSGVYGYYITTEAEDIAVDSSGNSYITGYTEGYGNRS
jgi:hypothetical protein